MSIGQVAGIRIYLHVTLLGLLVWIAFGHLTQGQGVAGAASGLLLNVAVFVVIVLHELGHALVARRFGIRTRYIILLPIGGISRLEGLPEEPRQELLIAIAGPAVNLVLAGLILAFSIAARVPVGPDGLRLVGGSVVAKLLWINLSLAAFNLLPALPMDGGRVLRAALTLRVGKLRATAAAARVAQAVAVLLGLAGSLSQPMLVLIALFVWMGARGELLGAQVQSALAGLTVRDAMVGELRTLAAAEPVRRAIELVVRGFQTDFPVERGGRPVGILTQADVLRAVTAGDIARPVEEAMRSTFATATADESLALAWERLQTSGLPVLVLDGGHLVGMLTAKNVGDAILLGRALRRRP